MIGCRFMTRVSAAIAAVLVSVFTTHAQSVFSGKGASDAEALREMRIKVASAYFLKISSCMLETYNDELRKASRASMDGMSFVRSVDRADVEAMFIGRRDKAVSVRNEAMKAEKSGDLGRARMYCYWAIALFKSVPGINESEIADLQRKYDSLDGNGFPATGASNIGSLAERIYRMEQGPSVRPVTVPVAVKPVLALKEPVSDESIEVPVRIEYASLPGVDDSATIADGMKNVREGIPGSVLPMKPVSMEGPVLQPSERQRSRIFAVTGVSLTPDLSASLMIGSFLGESWGIYVKGSTNFSDSSHEYVLSSEGTFSDGGAFWGTGARHVSRWSLTGGTVFMPLLGHRLGFHAGLGFLRRQVILEDLDGTRALSTAASSDGFCADAGLVFNAGRIMLTAGSTMARKNADLMVGVGVRF